MQLIDQLKARGFSVGANGAVTRSTDPSTPAPVVFCHNFNQNLKFGDDLDENGNGDMKYLKQVLRMEGFTQDLSESRNTLHALFGESTAEAVVSFQKKYGISQTGFVGPITRAKMNSLYGCGNSNSTTITCANGATNPPHCNADTLPVICTADAMQCPDGSYVGRSGPSCQFRACPGIISKSTKIEISTIDSKDWTIGQPVKITWKGENVPNGAKVGIEIGKEGSTKKEIVSGIDYSLTSYQFSPFSTRQGDMLDIISSGKYKLYIFLYTGIECIMVPNCTSTYKVLVRGGQDISIKIKNFSDKPELRVVSPNGGEVWKIGQTYTITLATKDELGMKTVRLNRYSDDGFRIGEETIGTTGTNTFSYKVPVGTSETRGDAGRYKIQVIVDKYDSGMGVADESDNYFSIVAF